MPFLGVLFAMLISIANQPQYIRAVEKNNGHAMPEARMPPMTVGGVLFSIGLFWFGWTAAPRYSWALSLVAAGETRSVSEPVALLIHSVVRFHGPLQKSHNPG